MKIFFARLAAVMIAWPLLAGAALAQQPTPAALASAKELVTLKGGSQMFEPVLTRMIDQTKAALLQTNPQLSKDLNDVAVTVRAEFIPRAGDLANEAARQYAQRFSDAELKELVTFYKSPVGQKMLVQEPQVLDQTFTFAETWGPRVAEEVMNRYRTEMKKKGHNL
jgi:uncharacterized protein